MSDDLWQIEIPESFVALYLTGGRGRPNAARAQIAARYELCEDLACGLHDAARAQHLDLGVAAREVLSRCHLGLADAQSGLGSEEAVWVTRRLAELLGWADFAVDPAALAKHAGP